MILTYSVTRLTCSTHVIYTKVYITHMQKTCDLICRESKANDSDSRVSDLFTYSCMTTSHCQLFLNLFHDFMKYFSMTTYIVKYPSALNIQPCYPWRRIRLYKLSPDVQIMSSHSDRTVNLLFVITMVKKLLQW